LDPLEYKLKLASEFEESKKYIHALQIYQPLLKHKIYKRIASVKVSGLYEKLNNNDLAIKILESYLKEEPQDAEVRKFLSHLLLRQNKNEEALEVLFPLSRKQNPDVFYLMGMANFNLKDYEISKLNFLEFMEVNEGGDILSEANLYLAKISIELENLDDASLYADKAIGLSGNNFEIYLTSAIIFYLKEMFVHAFTNIQKALKLKNEETLVQHWAGKILFKLGEYDKAEVYLRNTLLSSEPISETYSLLGFTYLNRKKIQDARLFFNKALKLNPSDKLAIEGIEKCSFV
jgi:Flp pilus assembly protein TadD